MSKKRFIINLLVYLAILFGGLYLYNPFINDSHNNPHSAVKFIYAQF